MGIKHLVKISDLMQDKKLYSKNEIRVKLGIDYYTVVECIEYLQKEKKIIRCEDNGVERYKWVARKSKVA